jgi:hypothetical protein
VGGDGVDAAEGVDCQAVGSEWNVDTIMSGSDSGRGDQGFVFI